MKKHKLEIIAFVLCLLIFPIKLTLQWASIGNEVITVTDKERINSTASSYYLVFTETDTYKMTDSWAFFRFDSSDDYGKLMVGKTYQCKTTWFRVPFLSMYRNLISCEEVTNGSN